MTQQRVFISTSKKAKSERQMFLSALMKQLSGDQGKQLITQFMSDLESDHDDFVQGMKSIGRKMLDAKGGAK